MTVTSPVEPAVRPKIHLNFLDGLRGVAALYVMFHHAWLTVWTDPRLFPTGKTGALTSWLAFGHISVTVFIVISGFCLMLPVARAGGQLRGGAAAFFKRRARRILPPYYCAIALSCLLLLTLIGQYTGALWDISIPYDFRGAIKAVATHVLLIHDFFDAYTLNHAFWSIAVEWQIYFLFPLLLILWRRPGPVVTTALVMAFSFWAANYAIIAANQIEPLNAHYIGFWAKVNHHLFRVLARLKQVNLHYLGLFTLGMFASSAAFSETGPLTWLKKRWALRGAAAVSAASMAAIIIFLRRLSIVDGVSHWLLIDFLAGIAASSLMLSMCHLPRHPVRDVLSWRPLVWMGTFSYSLYLIHGPMVQVIWQYMIRPLGLRPGPTFGLLSLAAAPIIPACAYVFFLSCEKPFLNTRPVVTSPIETSPNSTNPIASETR